MPLPRLDLDPLVRQRFLEKAAEFLAKTGNHRGVIRLVECWASIDTPSRMAVLLEARAFMKLLVMDRAWLRIRELLATEPGDVDAAALAAEMFLLQSWPTRARQLLDEALARHPDHPRLRWLASETTEGHRLPSARGKKSEKSNDPAELLARAERLLAKGSRVRSRTILTRLAAADPGNSRVQDLMWALEGDFDQAQAGPVELALELLPGLALPTSLAEMVSLVAGHEVDQAQVPERTPLPDVEEDVEFPALFRRIMPLPQPFTDDDMGDVTHPARLASSQEMRIEGDSGNVGRRPETSLEDDTSALPIPMDALQRGGSAAPQFIGRDPILESPAMLSTELVAPPPPPRDEKLAATGAPVARRILLAGTPPRIDRRIFVALGVVALGIGLAVLHRCGTASHADRIRDIAARAIDSDEYGKILRAEAVLWGHMDRSGPTEPGLPEALGRIEIALWEDHVNNAQHLEDARRFVKQALADPTSDPAHLASAELALSERRLGTAHDELAHYDVDDSGRWYAEGRLAQLDGDLAGAEQSFTRAIAAAPRALRSKRALIDLLVDEGRIREARALLLEAKERAPSNPRLRIAAERMRFDEMTNREVAVAMPSLLEALPSIQAQPRLEASLLHLGAETLSARGDTVHAVAFEKQAFGKDWTNPELLYRIALGELAEQHQLQALAHLQEALGYRPGDLEARIALVRVLLDLDRVGEAREQVAEAARIAPVLPRLSVAKAWIAAVGDEDLKSTRDLLAPYVLRNPTDGEALFILGYALVKAGDDSASRVMDAAIQALSRHRSHVSALLLPRARAARLLAFHGPAPAAAREEVLAQAPHDPWVYLLLAWEFPPGNPDSEAAAYLEQGEDVGPEFARIHFERGYYSIVARDGYVQTKESWKRYMDLEPNGAREARAIQVLAQM
jgi:predicted Zn-dependent protease